MSSDGVTKVELHKQTPNTGGSDKNSELDKEDFQKAAQDAKDSVSSTLQSAKEFVVGPSNDAEDKTKSSQASESAKDTADGAREQTASAVDYVKKQLETPADKEDPEVTDFKKAAADTAHDVKKSVDPNDKSSSKPNSDKTVLESVQDAATSVYNKIVPSAEAKEPSEARQHLNRAGDAAEHAGSDIRNSAYELKEAVKDGARQYGRSAQDRAANYGDEARSVSPADQMVDDVKGDLDRYSTRARNQAEETYQEGKEKGRGVWGNIQSFFGGGKDRAEDAADYGRDRARSAQDRLNRGYENTPSGGDIRREGRAAWDNAKAATADSGRYVAGRLGAAANGDSRDNSRDSGYSRGGNDARDDFRDRYQDAKQNVRDSYRETKQDVKDTFSDAKESVRESYRETKDSIKDRYNETNRELNRSIDQAKRSWRDSLTPHSYFEAAWSKGEIPSNTEDILRSRGVYSIGDPRLQNQTDDAQAHAQGKVMQGEDFLRQTEFGYGEENLGGDDLSELRAASDGHGPYAKYR